MEGLIVYLRMKNKVVASCSLYCWKCHGRRAAPASASRGDATELEHPATASYQWFPSCQYGAEGLHTDISPSTIATRGSLRLHLQGKPQFHFRIDLWAGYLTTPYQIIPWCRPFLHRFLEVAQLTRKFRLCGIPKVQNHVRKKSDMDHILSQLSVKSTALRLIFLKSNLISSH